MGAPLAGAVLEFERSVRSVAAEPRKPMAAGHSVQSFLQRWGLSGPIEHELQMIRHTDRPRSIRRLPHLRTHGDLGLPADNVLRGGDHFLGRLAQFFRVGSGLAAARSE